MPSKSARRRGTRPSPPPWASRKTRPCSLVHAWLEPVRSQQRGSAGHHHQRVRSAGKIGTALRVEPPPEPDRGIEHGPWRNTPPVGVLLQRRRMPSRRVQWPQVGGGERLPRRRPAERRLLVRQVRLQLHQAREFREHLADRRAGKRRGRRRQQVAERLVAGQELHRQPAAAVGRAEHQDAGALGVGEPTSQGRVPELQRSHQQATRGMRDETNGRAPVPARRASAPFTTAASLPAEVSIGWRQSYANSTTSCVPPSAAARSDVEVQEPVRRDPGAPRAVCELAEAAGGVAIQPHAARAGLEMTAEHAGHQDRRGTARIRRAARAACAPARVPVADWPLHDSGPMALNAGGRSCTSALTIAPAV